MKKLRLIVAATIPVTEKMDQKAVIKKVTDALKGQGVGAKVHSRLDCVDDIKAAPDETKGE